MTLFICDLSLELRYEVLMNCFYHRMSKTLERYQHWCYASQDPNVVNRDNAQVCVLSTVSHPFDQAFCDLFFSCTA